MKKIYNGNEIVFLYESGLDTGVGIAADFVREDLFRMTEKRAKKITTLDGEKLSGKLVILFGIYGNSPIIQELEENGVLDYACLEGKREVFSFQLCEHIYPEIEHCIVIAGSDKRGTMYGLLHISDLLGVSPFVDWSNVLPERREQINIQNFKSMVSKEPSVRYRGIFINDEWPAFGNWCRHRFGGFNAKMYRHVFELLIRLKANYLWPAMWSACFSMDGPDLANAVLANEMGIVVGSSHHEPCMRNGEEYGKMRGKASLYGDAWDFRTNRDGIIRFWQDGLKRNQPFESMITLGMRGERDTPILGSDSSLQDNIDLLRDVLRVQNKEIQTIVGEKVPRLFVLFTEVEQFYYGSENVQGLQNAPELRDATIMLSDDNFGNLRSIPSKEMQKHKGGLGLYYHFDFHGGAYAYDWINTNYLPKIWEQLTCAYENNIREVWVVNVGDLCFLEYPMQYLFEMAYDMDAWIAPNQTDFFTKKWVKNQFASVFAQEECDAICELLAAYTRMNHNRKPEILQSGDYHPVHFGETKHLLERMKKCMKACEELYVKCSEEMKPAFYELIYYPVMASSNLARMQLLAGQNEWYAKQGRVVTNRLADEVQNCIERDRVLTAKLHRMADEKWYGMGMSEHVGFVNWMEEENHYPWMIRIEPANKPRILVSKEDSMVYTAGGEWTGKTLYFDDFLRPDCHELVFDISCASKESVQYQIQNTCEWITLSKTQGSVSEIDHITVWLHRDLLDGENGEEQETMIKVQAENTCVPIVIRAQNSRMTEMDSMVFVERDGYISIEAKHFQRKVDVPEGEICVLKDYGRSCDAWKVLPSNRSFASEEPHPIATYAFALESGGKHAISFYLSPSNTMRNLWIRLNDGELMSEQVLPEGYKSSDCSSTAWVQAVRDNVRIYTTCMDCIEGINHLEIHGIEEGLVLEKIVIYPENQKPVQSYLGPPESFYIE